MIFLPFYPLKIIIANLALGFTSSKHQVGKNKSEYVMKCVNDVYDVRFMMLCVIFTLMIQWWVWISFCQIVWTSFFWPAGCRGREGG